MNGLNALKLGFQEEEGVAFNKIVLGALDGAGVGSIFLKGTLIGY
jgi:hypothetical protein